MASLIEYFEKNRPRPVWQMGDRVFGHWNKIPFIGTVGCDNVRSELEGPRVSIFLDLPIQYQGTVVRIIRVKQKDIKRLVSFDEEPKKSKSKNGR